MASLSNNILCITHSEDSYPIDWVASHLDKCGYTLIRFNSDDFPVQSTLSGYIDDFNSDTLFNLGKKSFSCRDIGAVWHRKNRAVNLSAITDETLRRQAFTESEQIKNILLRGLEDLYWLDHPHLQMKAEDKWLQLKYASRSGLSIPRTLFSNCPKQVRLFYSQCDGNIVTKMHTPLTVSMGKPSAFVYTNKIRPEHLDQLDSLKYSPMIFQQHIEKRQELRIVYVNGKTFAAHICAKNHKNATLTDWRQADPRLSRWESAEIPDSLTANISAMMGRLGLDFGVVDMILDTNNQYQFLEVNPSGEWGMLEAELGLPISEHIAHALITKHPV